MIRGDRRTLHCLIVALFAACAVGCSSSDDSASPAVSTEEGGAGDAAVTDTAVADGAVSGDAAMDVGDAGDAMTTDDGAAMDGGGTDAQDAATE